MRSLPERLEELADAYAQVAAPSDPAILRQRRQRRRRRAVAVGSLTLLALLLAGAVAVHGQLGAARRPAPGPIAPSPSTKPGRPQTTKPPIITGTVTRPQEGYRLQLPAGWYAVAVSEPKQIALEHGRPGGRADAEVYVRTALTLDPRLTTATDRKAAVLAAGPATPGGLEAETFANMPATAGTRPDGRRFLTVDVDFIGGGIPDLLYQITWPYHCAPGGACPASTRLRVLQFVASASSKKAWARLRPVIERMVSEVQPIGDAVGGTAPAHPPCAYGRNGDVKNPHPPVQVTGDRSAVLFHVGVASVRAMPCHFRGTLTIRLVEETDPLGTGRGQPPLLRVGNNGAAVTLDGDLPEGTAGSGVLSVTWKWTNWCGNKSVRAEVVGPGGAVEELPLRTLPRCTDRAAPSVLTRVSR
jgi:hypothetical protein